MGLKRCRARTMLYRLLLETGNSSCVPAMKIINLLQSERNYKDYLFWSMNPSKRKGKLDPSEIFYLLLMPQMNK